MFSNWRNLPGTREKYFGAGLNSHFNSFQVAVEPKEHGAIPRHYQQLALEKIVR
jgi:hypothetical protein